MSYVSGLLGAGLILDADRFNGLFQKACRAISQNPAPTKSWIYFIVRPSYPIATVKIGLSNGAPDRRLAALQTGCPEKLVMGAALLGHAAHEEMLHCVVAQNWMRGEWFCLDPDLALFVTELVSRGLSKATESYIRALVANVDGYKGSEHHKFLKLAPKWLSENHPFLAARGAVTTKVSHENRVVAKTLDQAQLLSLPLK